MPGFIYCKPFKLQLIAHFTALLLLERDMFAIAKFLVYVHMDGQTNLMYK